jgi:hypothetical protein
MEAAAVMHAVHALGPKWVWLSLLRNCTACLYQDVGGNYALTKMS